MLKNLVIFALLFGLFAHEHGDDRQPAAGAAQSQNPASPTASAAVEQHSGSKLQQDGSQEQAAGEPKSVRIILPPKDSYDYWIFGASIALAVIGIGGVVIGTCSLIFIRKQTGEIHLQRIVTHNTLNAIKVQAGLLKRQADALDMQNKAIRDRERARLAVIFPPEEPDFAGPTRLMIFEEPELMLAITIAIHNEGPTKAFSVRAEAGFQFQIKDSKFLAKEPTLPQTIPDVIRDEDVNNPIKLTIESLATDREVKSMQRAELDFYLFGEIKYEDVFGFERKTPFRFLWQVEEYNESDGSLRFYSTWVNESPQST